MGQPSRIIAGVDAVKMKSKIRNAIVLGWQGTNQLIAGKPSPRRTGGFAESAGMICWSVRAAITAGDADVMRAGSP